MNNKNKKIDIINNKILDLKKIYFYSRKMSGGKRSREIEKEGYSYFKPKLDNKRQDFEYDIKSEIQNLINKKTILNNFNSKKEFKDYYDGFNFREALNPKLNKINEPKEENVIKMDEEFNLIDKQSCNSCFEVFGNIKDLVIDFDNNSKVIHKKITEYYNLLLKAYTFDYMTDPSISNRNRIQKLNECYNNIINKKCIYDNNKTFNYFTLDFKNNLEIINVIFN
jgi:hypothetical protein